jgi:hypothetical protein
MDAIVGLGTDGFWFFLSYGKINGVLLIWFVTRNVQVLAWSSEGTDYKYALSGFLVLYK